MKTSTKQIDKKGNKKSFSFVVNSGIYLSIFNIFITSLIVFVCVQLFMDPINYILWISSLGVFAFILFVSLLLTTILFVKIILNNQQFLNNEQVGINPKKYFIAATIFFFWNSLISFFMYKKLLTN